MPERAADDAHSAEDIELARRLLAEWDTGRGTSKSKIEIRVWGDATAHGRRFDRFVRRTLGESTTRPVFRTSRALVSLFGPRQADAE